MGALFQAVATQLGNLGSGIAEARDKQTTEANENEKTQFDQQQKLREFAEQQKVDALNAQVQQSLMKARASGQVVDMGTYQDPKTKQWSRQFYNVETGKTISLPLPGDPESVVRTNDQQDAITGRAQALEATRQANRVELQKLRDQDALRRKQAASGVGGKGGTGASVPLAVARWYKVLGGATVDTQINALESMLKSMELTSMGAPGDVYQNGLYVQTQESIKQLRQQQSQLWQQAMQRAGAAPNASNPAGASIPASGGSSKNMSFDANGNPTN